MSLIFIAYLYPKATELYSHNHQNIVFKNPLHEKMLHILSLRWCNQYNSPIFKIQSNQIFLVQPLIFYNNSYLCESMMSMY